MTLRPVLATLGLLCLVAAVVVALATRPAPDVGTVLSDPSPSPEVAAAPDAQDTPSPSPSTEPTQVPTPAPSPIATRSARLEDQPAPTPVVAPARIEAPAIGVDNPVVEVGVDPDGLMTIPDDVDEIGWYRFGPSPGAPGAAVLAGHVDDRVQGRGAFFDLQRLDLGDQVTTTDAEGESTTWVVTGRRTYDKVSLPIDELMTREGPPRLVLITCGGEFDGSARSYESNVVVVAEPLGG